MSAMLSIGPTAVGGLVVSSGDDDTLESIGRTVRKPSDSVKIDTDTNTGSSHLPSWVLKMRLKIANSRMEHANVESALYNLNQHSMDLDKQLLLLRPVLKVPIIIEGIKVPGDETVDDRSSKDDTRAAMKQTMTTTKICILYLIPDDVFICILDYLWIKHILMLNQLSKSFQTLLNSSSYWLKSFPIYCPHLQRFVTKKKKKKKKSHIDDNDDDRGVDYKSCIQSYFRNVYICTSFLQSMKEQRCIPKHKQIAPHRHRKQERQVTHPLPVFDSTNSSNSSRRGDEQLIMSHAETMSSDYRSIAHKSLTIMLTETNFIDNPLNFKLVNDGVITVLTALLSNEEGALQNYACAIMANLLCWENQNRFVFNIIKKEKVTHTSPLISNEGVVDTTSITAQGSSLQATSVAATEEEEEEVNIISQQELKTIQKRTFSILSTLQALFRLNDKDVSQIVSLASQITACRGDRQLATLLTSPSASINLAGTFTQVTSDGYKETRRTANVQGMCSQQASRALVGLFYPSMAIPSVVNYDPEINHPSSTSSSSSSSSSSGSTSSTENELSIDKKRGGPSSNMSFSPPCRRNPSSVTVTDEKALLLSSYNKKANDNDSIDISTSTSAMLRSCIPVLVPIQLRAPCINSIFLSDIESRPWQFTYFHKSGSFKDQFITYLRFFPDNILKGRGIDSIGVFYVKGRAEAGIAGWSWLFDKSYVSSLSIELLGYDSRQWMQLSDEASYNELEGIGKAAVHVKHVGYWSDGIDNRDYDTLTHYEDHHRYHYRAQDSKFSSHEEEDIGVW